MVLVRFQATCGSGASRAGPSNSELRQFKANLPQAGTRSVRSGLHPSEHCRPNTGLARAFSRNGEPPANSDNDVGDQPLKRLNRHAASNDDASATPLPSLGRPIVYSVRSACRPAEQDHQATAGGSRKTSHARIERRRPNRRTNGFGTSPFPSRAKRPPKSRLCKADFVAQQISRPRRFRETRRFGDIADTDAPADPESTGFPDSEAPPPAGFSKSSPS